MLAKNPNGKVPILEDGDFVLWESTAMLAYIAAKAGRTDLAPTTPRERAEVDRWTAWQGAHFGPAIRKVSFERIVKKLVGRGAPDEAVVKAGIAEFLDFAEEGCGIKHDAVADDALAAGAENSAGDELEDEFFAVDDDRVSSVMAAGVAGDDVEFFAEDVDDLALAFIAPLGADDDHDRHHSSGSDDSAVDSARGGPPAA